MYCGLLIIIVMLGWWSELVKSDTSFLNSGFNKNLNINSVRSSKESVVRTIMHATTFTDRNPNVNIKIFSCTCHPTNNIGGACQNIHNMVESSLSSSVIANTGSLVLKAYSNALKNNSLANATCTKTSVTINLDLQTFAKQNRLSTSDVELYDSKVCKLKGSCTFFSNGTSDIKVWNALSSGAVYLLQDADAEIIKTIEERINFNRKYN